MSSTNKTSHYNLSQYVGSDKPTYLVDYNGDMAAIDTGIYAAKSEADTNTTSIGTLSSLTTEAQSNLVGAINEVDAHADTNAGNITTNTTNIASNTSHIGVMANLETTEKSNLVGAINEVNAFKEVFNLTVRESFDENDMTPTNCTVTYSNTSLMRNSDGSIFKLYGLITVNAPNYGSSEISIQTSLRPTEEYTIDCAGTFAYSISGDATSSPISLTVKTTGEVVIGFYNSEVGSRRLILNPCLYFNKSFGDTPSNN